MTVMQPAVLIPGQELLEDRARRVPEMPPSGIFDTVRRHEPDGVVPPHLIGDEHEALTFHPLPNSKPTNPKDAVGVRKAPMSTVPMGVIVEMGVGMLEGSAKYGRHNYRCAWVRSSVYFDALMRHMIAWWEGEDIDPDSGMSHVTKALCTLAVLRDAQMQDMLTDDRPPRSQPFYPALNTAAGAILDKHSDKKPRHYTIADTGLKL